MLSPRVELKEFDLKSLKDERLDVLVIGGVYTGKTATAIELSRHFGGKSVAWVRDDAQSKQVYESRGFKTVPIDLGWMATGKVEASVHIIDDDYVACDAHRILNCYNSPVSTIMCTTVDEILSTGPQFDLVVFTSKPPKDIVHVVGDGKHQSSQISVYNMVRACARDGSLLVFDARENKYYWMKLRKVSEDKRIFSSNTPPQ